MTIEMPFSFSPFVSQNIITIGFYSHFTKNNELPNPTNAFICFNKSAVVRRMNINRISVICCHCLFVCACRA